MKKIIFVRHGKAEEPAPEFPDFERSLTVKGKTVTRLMAQKLKERETALIFAGVYAVPPEKIVINSDLYFSIDKNSFMDILRNIEEDVETVTLFGHNPSFTELPGLLGKESIDVMPKSGIICLSFKTRTWSGINHNTGVTEYFLKPNKVL
jgi:phosphohistidine phosphatase